MYNIYLYNTHTGGGIAFIEESVPVKKSIYLIPKVISHNWDICECYFVGTANEINFNEFDFNNSYDVFDEKEGKYHRIELGFNIYYYGGDCC